VESALRFYAVWWVAAGPVLWQAAGRVGNGDPRVRQLALITTAGGVARLVAAWQSGLPHPLFQALTVTELIGGPLLALCDDRVSEIARRAPAAVDLPHVGCDGRSTGSPP